MQRKYVTIIGGANIDITGSPYYNLNSNDSNPGKTIMSLGGVARNIAENLSRMGVDIEFITVLGDDLYSKEIKDSCNKLNISLEHSQTISGERTSSYLCITNELGEMQLAISDMEIYENITPSYLEKNLDMINGGVVCIADTNITHESLHYLVNNCKVPIFIDTVSTNKTEKIKNVLHGIHTLKPNIIEAEILSGMKIESMEDLEKATDSIIDKGVKNIFVTSGPKGVYYTDGITKGNILPISTNIVNTTGAGDSYLAAVVWAYLKGFNLEKSAKAGLAASSICIKSNMTVSEDISSENIINIMENNWRD
jgi:pseudouridine kinase